MGEKIKKPRHASSDEHHAVHEEAHQFLEDHAHEGAKAAPDECVALVAKLGLSGDEVRALLGAEPATPEELRRAGKVNLASVARGFPTSVTQALVTAGPVLALGKKLKPEHIRDAADRTRLAASSAAKLRLQATAIEQAARRDADLLDQTARTIVPQIEARAIVEPEFGDTFSPVTAYHHARYPGGGGKAREPEVPEKADEASQ